MKQQMELKLKKGEWSILDMVMKLLLFENRPIFSG